MFAPKPLTHIETFLTNNPEKHAFPGSGVSPADEGVWVEGALAHRGLRTARRATADPKPKAGLVPDLGRLSRGSRGNLGSSP